MPYLDEPLVDLVRRLRVPPRHILLNKEVTLDGPTVVTLENFGMAEVPYQIRNGGEVPAALEALGYDIIDSWNIEQLAPQDRDLSRARPLRLPQLCRPPEAMNARVAGEAPAGRPVGMVIADKTWEPCPLWRVLCFPV